MQTHTYTTAYIWRREMKKKTENNVMYYNHKFGNDNARTLNEIAVVLSELKRVSLENICC